MSKSEKLNLMFFIFGCTLMIVSLIIPANGTFFRILGAANVMMGAIGFYFSNEDEQGEK